MTAAVTRVSEHAFAELDLVRIAALVFHFNAASARVLEKADFRFEGKLRQYFKKDGTLLDGLIYARVKEV
jgi:ribosomal-protein-alanine N-acetyltransferase